MSHYHVPVMLSECIEALNINPTGIYLDCTLGGGGHSEAILNKLKGSGKLYSIDQDPEALTFAKERLAAFSNINYCYGNFSEMSAITGLNANSVDGILMDLGVSSHQIDAGYRGFSFMQEGELDMRMDSEKTLSAKEIVNGYSIQDLKRIFFEYGEENMSAQIAKKIVESRSKKAINTTQQLREIIEGCIPQKHANKSLARIFQALRIEVNAEMLALKKALDEAYSLLNHDGRLVIMSYHSLEDRMVKQFMKSKVSETYNPDRPVEFTKHYVYFELLGRKPIEAGQYEQEDNPRSRSAKLRVAIKKITT